MTATQSVTGEAVAAAIASHGYRYTNEHQLHVGLAAAMAAAGLDPHPEVRLGDAGRIDFLVDRVGVEVKVAGETEPLLRQVTRYAHRDEIDELVVVTTRRKHRALPDTVAGKPLQVVMVGGV